MFATTATRLGYRVAFFPRVEETDLVGTDVVAFHDDGWVAIVAGLEFVPRPLLTGEPEPWEHDPRELEARERELEASGLARYGFGSGDLDRGRADGRRGWVEHAARGAEVRIAGHFLEHAWVPLPALELLEAWAGGVTGGPVDAWLATHRAESEERDDRDVAFVAALEGYRQRCDDESTEGRARRVAHLRGLAASYDEHAARAEAARLEGG